MGAVKMVTPGSLYEAASFELNQFRERRMAERRTTQRDTPDRRITGDDVQEQGSSNTGQNAIYHPPGRA